MTAPVTIDLDEKTLTELDKFGANMERSRSGMINLAFQEWLAAQVDFITEIEAGSRTRMRVGLSRRRRSRVSCASTMFPGEGGLDSEASGT